MLGERRTRAYWDIAFGRRVGLQYSRTCGRLAPVSAAEQNIAASRIREEVRWGPRLRAGHASGIILSNPMTWAHNQVELIAPSTIAAQRTAPLPLRALSARSESIEFESHVAMRSSPAANETGQKIESRSQRISPLAKRFRTRATKGAREKIGVEHSHPPYPLAFRGARLETP
jgi:hypothetical protein